MSSILTNDSASIALMTLQSINSNIADVQSQISTGRKVAGADDNAATGEPPEWDNADASGPSGNNGGGNGGKAPGTELDDEIPF